MWSNDVANRLIRRWSVAATAIVLASACSACDWPWAHDMADQPSSSAPAGPRSPAMGTTPIAGNLPLSAESAERQLRSPIPPDAPTESGHRLYTTYCTPCHGPTGAGDGPVAREFAPPMGALDAPDVQAHQDGWFYAVISNGTRNMPRSAHELDAMERWEIVHFLRTFKRPTP
jgi:mono/diheme cytochrome c family protein